VIATVTSIVLNLSVKLALIVGLSFGAVGLALGTSIGAWLNLAILGVIATSRGFLKLDERLTVGGPRIIGAAAYSALVAWLVAAPLDAALSGVTVLRAEIYLALLGVTALLSYGVALIGFGWKR